MARGSRPTPFTGSAFLRRLAALEEDPAAVSDGAFLERLGRWFDWTDAIALSAALGAPSPVAAAPSSAAGGGPAFGQPHGREVARVRTLLAQGLADWPDPVATQAEGFAPWRERLIERQRAMEAAIAALRRRLRAALAAGTPSQARLAALDAVLEPVIVARERELLATVPRWLERSFERRRRATPGALGTFRRDLVELLQAELDFRMQPVEGLLAALDASSPESS